MNHKLWYQWMAEALEVWALNQIIDGNSSAITSVNTHENNDYIVCERIGEIPDEYFPECGSQPGHEDVEGTRSHNNLRQFCIR